MTNTEIKQVELPQGFVLRCPTMDDVEAVVDLINQRKIVEYGEPEMRVEDVLLTWKEPGFNLATDAWVVLTPDQQLIAYAKVSGSHHVHFHVNADVHRAHQGRGIGTSLLQLIERRAAEQIAEAPAGARVALATQVSSVNTVGQRFLERHGFTLVRRFWRMGIELQEVPSAAQWPEGMTVRSTEPGMERAVYEVDEDAFRDHWGFMSMSFEDWSHWAMKGKYFDTSLWFLAMDGDEIAAIAVCANEEESGGWVHILGVRRPWRRKGVGLALLYHAFGEFYRRGVRNVYLGVDAQSLTGATRLYERAGMHVVRESRNYEKELRAGKELSTQSLEV